jgi:hypothetical protein
MLLHNRGRQIKMESQCSKFGTKLMHVGEAFAHGVNIVLVASRVKPEISSSISNKQKKIPCKAEIITR